MGQEPTQLREQSTAGGQILFVRAIGFGHPGTRQPGYDMLFVRAKSQELLNQFNQRAQIKGWDVWISGNYMRANETVIDSDWPYGSALYKATKIK